MGCVYRAADRELGETIALKVLHRDLVGSEEMVERFRQEVRLARRVTHRNVARTFDIGEHEGEKFLTMELVDGEALSAILARERRLSSKRIVEIATAICEGLSAAHEAGVVHRDLKPDNVLVAKDGRVVITDFGIARAFEPGSATKTQGLPVGTPAYMAPEQAAADPHVDHRADIYAVGALAYEMLCGRPPFTAPTPQALLAAHITQAPDPATRYRPAISPQTRSTIAPQTRPTIAPQTRPAIAPQTRPAVADILRNEPGDARALAWRAEHDEKTGDEGADAAARKLSSLLETIAKEYGYDISRPL